MLVHNIGDCLQTAADVLVHNIGDCLQTAADLFDWARKKGNVLDHCTEFGINFVQTYDNSSARQWHQFGAALRLPIRKRNLENSSMMSMRVTLPGFLFLFFIQPSCVRGLTSAFLLDVLGFCGATEGRLGHFLLPWLRLGWQSVTNQGKIPWNTPPWRGIEPGS